MLSSRFTPILDGNSSLVVLDGFCDLPEVTSEVLTPIDILVSLWNQISFTYLLLGSIHFLTGPFWLRLFLSDSELFPPCLLCQSSTSTPALGSDS